MPGIMGPGAGGRHGFVDPKFVAHVMETAWSIEDPYGFSWCDALLVAQALRAGCGTLLTADLQHGQEVFGLRIVNPFEEGPGA